VQSLQVKTTDRENPHHLDIEGLCNDQENHGSSCAGVSGQKINTRKSAKKWNYRKPPVRRSEEITTQTSDDAERDNDLNQGQSSDAGMRGKTEPRPGASGRKNNVRKSAKSRNYRRPPVRQSKKITTQTSDDMECDKDLSQDRSSDAGMRGKTKSRPNHRAGRSAKPPNNHDRSTKQATTRNRVTFAHATFDTNSSGERSPSVGPKPPAKLPPRRNPGRSAKSNTILTMEAASDSTMATYRRTGQDRDNTGVEKMISKRNLAPRSNPRKPNQPTHFCDITDTLRSRQEWQ
jgi:hypothetical protein